jgi:hypothetical protein
MIPGTCLFDSPALQWYYCVIFPKPIIKYNNINLSNPAIRTIDECVRPVTNASRITSDRSFHPLLLPPTCDYRWTVRARGDVVLKIPSAKHQGNAVSTWRTRVPYFVATERQRTHRNTIRVLKFIILRSVTLNAISRVRHEIRN